MKAILDMLSSHKSELYSTSDIDCLREKYSIKG